MAAAALHAQDAQRSVSSKQDGAVDAKLSDDTPANVLSPDDWQRVDAAVDRALTFLAAQQQPDGSFPTMPHGQPGVTSLCVLAFMSHGHKPGEGQYGERLERSTTFILSCQKDNGLVAKIGPEVEVITRDVTHEIGVAAAYNHAIASLTISEVYGTGRTKRAEPIQNAIKASLGLTLDMQRWPKERSLDSGGWRYVCESPKVDSDLSVTGWQLMFLRSARNAGFDVPESAIDDAVGYVRRTFNDEYGAFAYAINSGEQRSRAMAGAGILALGHAGFHNSPEAERTGQWLMRYNFDVYNHNDGLERDRYHYSLFMCCQGMYQLGSPYWDQFFPPPCRRCSPIRSRTAPGMRRA